MVYVKIEEAKQTPETGNSRQSLKRNRSKQKKKSSKVRIVEEESDYDEDDDEDDDDDNYVTIKDEIGVDDGEERPEVKICHKIVILFDNTDLPLPSSNPVATG